MFKPEAFIVGSIARLIVKKWGSRASGRSKADQTAATPARSDQPAGLQGSGRDGNPPTRAAAYNLADLIAGITDENRHEMQEAGPPIGREIW